MELKANSYNLKPSDLFKSSTDMQEEISEAIPANTLFMIHLDQVRPLWLALHGITDPLHPIEPRKIAAIVNIGS